MEQQRRSQVSILRSSFHFIDTGKSSYFNEDPSPKLPIQNESWMGQLDDQMLVSEVSIPGTHDSGTYSCQHWWQFGFTSQAQSMDITTQLRAGIRFFDLRLRLKNDQIIIEHSVSYPESMFKDILREIDEFLKKNSGEFVILALQGNWQDSNKHERLKIIRKMLGGHEWAIMKKQIPTVQQLRGKAWVFCGVGIDFRDEEGKDQSFRLDGLEVKFDEREKYYLQNAYNIVRKSKINQPLHVTLQQKQEWVNQMSFSKKDYKKMRFNYLSGAGSGRLGEFDILNKVHGPRYYAGHEEGPNARMYFELSDIKPTNPIGVVIMDFPGVDLISKIIDVNWKEQPQ